MSWPGIAYAATTSRRAIRPERIVFEFVQGKLRDVVNTKAMTEVMQSRAELNREVMLTLQEKETQYGVGFITCRFRAPRRRKKWRRLPRIA